MKRTRLQLNSDSHHLSAVGYLYAAPAPAVDPSGAQTISIRNTVFPEFDLAPGDYVFRFWVKNGEGKFEIVAGDPQASWSCKASYDTTQQGFEGLSFKFTVAS